MIVLEGIGTAGTIIRMNGHSEFKLCKGKKKDRYMDG